MTAARGTIPLLEYRSATRYNLRALVDHSPAGALAAPGEHGPLRRFLKGYGVEIPLGRARDEDGDPLDKLRTRLAQTEGTGPSRFSEGF